MPIVSARPGTPSDDAQIIGLVIPLWIGSPPIAISRGQVAVVLERFQPGTSEKRHWFQSVGRKFTVEFEHISEKLEAHFASVCRTCVLEEIKPGAILLDPVFHRVPIVADV